MSDALIALAYYSIPLTLFYFVRKRQDLPFNWVFLLFSAFIVACGTTHLLEIWTLWHPIYWLVGGMKLMTAGLSLTTAIALVSIVPQALALSSPAQLELTNAALQQEIADRTQAELAASRLAAIGESSGDAIIGKSLDGTITSWNASAERLFGYTAAEVMDRPIALLFPPDHAEELAPVLERIKHGETIERYETVRVRKDGQRLAIAATISPIKDATGQVVGAAKIARDMTARKQAEVSLRESENRFQTFMNNSPAAAWITDTEGRILYLSETYSRLFPIPPDAVGKTIFELFVPEIAAEFQRNIRQVVETNQAVEAIEPAPRPDGTLGSFLVYKFPLHELSGQFCVGGIAVDITEREQAKEQLRSLNERLQYLLTHAPVVILSCKVEGDYGATSISENIRIVLGYEPQAFCADSAFWSQHIHPEDRDRIFANVSQIFVTGHHAHDYRFLHGDGEYRWVYNQLQLMRDAAGNPTEIIGYLVDISDRKQAEEALRQSDRRFRAIFSTMFQFIGLLTPDGILLEANQAALEFAGVTPADVINRPFWETRWWSSSAATQAQLKAAIAQAATGQFIRYEVDVLGIGETVATIDFSLKPIQDETGKVVLLIPEGRDISDRKQTEAALRQSEARNQALIQAIPDLLIQMKQDGTYLDIQANGKVRLLNASQMAIGNNISTILPADKAQERMWYVQRALQTRELQVYEYQLRIDGTLQFEEARILPCGEDEVLVIVRDISDRKLAAMQLELQSIIVRNMAEGVCMVKVSDGRFVYANPKFERMFGYDADELIGQHVAIVNYEDKSTNTRVIYEALAKTILEHGEAVYEVHNVKKDGTSCWCQATTSVFEHPDYGAVFVVVQQNITERKQAERMLQASLQEKEVLLKEIHHRVKNNLGVVDGLLQMQMRRSQSADVREILQESQNRITSIALVHEKLYGSPDLAKIDFAYYIADLTAHLFDSYNIHLSQIKLIMQVDPVTLGIDTAIPCGLIINELVSNALKYAFADRSTGEIQVTLHQQPDRQLTLVVRDNGSGLPHDFDLK